MSVSKIASSKRVVAFGLSAALALGGMPALGAISLTDRAYAADTNLAVANVATSDEESESLTTAATDANDEATPTLTFTNSGIEAAGADSGYEIDGTTLTIVSAGTYRVTGSCSDGCIAVKKGLSDVTIILDNLTLAKDGDKAIKFKSGSSGAIVLVGENTLSTTNDKGVIKANAAVDDDDNIIYSSDGTTTGGDLVISGDGTLNLSSNYSAVVDGETEGCDAINCEGDLTVLSGVFNIDVTDDGMHSDNTLTIGAQNTAGPTITISGAEEGLEGATVALLSGTGDIATNDDGLNAANSDLVTYNWQYGITVAGGTWKVVAGGDGLDSNGNLTISGGTAEVYCTGSGNGALDYGEGAEGEIRGTFSITGGTLFAVGSDMMVTPSSGNYALFGGAGGMGTGGGPGRMNGGFGPQATEQVEGDGDATNQAYTQEDAALAEQAASSSTVVTKGETVTVSTSDATLFQTVADASGVYALFASDGLAANTQVTLANGSSTTTATVGSGATSGQGQRPGQPGQSGQPGQPGQSSDGQQPGQPGDGQQPGQPGDGQQPPALPDGQQPSGDQTDTSTDNAQTSDGTTDASSDATAGTTADATSSTDQADQADQTDQLADNPMTVTKTKRTLKAAALKKSSKTVKAIKVKKAKGIVTYTKVSGSKYLKVNSSTGKITVKKGTPAGTYKVRVKVSASGNAKYAAASKTVVVKIKVK